MLQNTITAISDNPAHQLLARRARAKYMTIGFVSRLAGLKTFLEDGYRKTLNCTAFLNETSEGQLTTRYCGNRWCLACTRIRMGKAINRYRAELTSWKELHFVTLTRPNVDAEELSNEIAALRDCSRKLLRRVRRARGVPIKAIRKIECTYNPARNDYHPHLHFLVSSRVDAVTLRDAWLAENASASAHAQSIEEWKVGHWVELFKYFTKVVTKDKSRRRVLVPVAALDVIFYAMRGVRVFQPIGFVLDPTTDEEGEIVDDGRTRAPHPRGVPVRWTWMQALHDWVDQQTGECLTGYEPTAAVRRFADRMRLRSPP